jgi:dolichol-phosphate mannosyltransferase
LLSLNPLELSVVVPTFEERENVLPLLARLETALAGIQWEVIFVDDHSPDGTAELLRQVALRDPRVRVIERIGRRGLSSACIEGMMAAPARYLAVMDADLQHDESILPRMLGRMRESAADIVVATRAASGCGGMGHCTWSREQLSRLGRRVSRLICRCEVTDPMSGFFLIDAAFFRARAPRLSGSGFKILLDILASGKTPPRVEEVAYTFRRRQAGTSKLDINVQLEYLFLILDKLIGHWLPTRYVVYLGVGALGVGVHLLTLALLYRTERVGFVDAQVAATFVAMTSNFLLNNAATFRAQRLRGAALISGLIVFYLACSVGATINVSLASLLTHSGMQWWLAGVLGMAVSSVWNYGANTVLTWRRSYPADEHTYDDSVRLPDPDDALTS